MSLQKNVASQKWRVFAFNITTGAAVTSDAANITAKIDKDWAGVNATDDVNPTEVEDGYYTFDLTQAETNADALDLYPESSTGSVQVIGVPGSQNTDFRFDPANDDVAVVTLVGTTTTNTDMVGTDSALLASTFTTMFAGITALAEWLGLIAGKQVADATALTEIKATGAGSGTYSETTDSQEALSEAAAAIPTTAMRGTDNVVLAGPTKSEMDTAHGLLATEAKQDTAASVFSTMFSGITALAQWLGLIAGKQTGNATARTELRATGAGSGTYDETTDSLEALEAVAGAIPTTAMRGTDSALLASTFATFSAGITALAEWLGLIAGKQVGNATARTELRATGAGSGTFDETVDSQEAIRDTAPLGTVMRGTNSAALASVATEGRLAELDAANLPADVDTLLSRLTSTIFTGMTSLAEWLGLIAGKQTGDATARTELRATGAGSGTFDETTDAQEAIRDTAPLGTAMRGTDGANTTTPPTTDAIRDAILPTQNVAFPNIEFLWVAASDHVTPVTAASGTSVTRSIDGGAFAAATGTLAEVANGIYVFDASAADMNGGIITFRFVATGGTPGAPDDKFLTIVTGGGV